LIVNQLQFSVMHTNMIDAGIQMNTLFENSVDRTGYVLDYCRLHDITIQAWSPFQFGFFEGVFVDNDRFPELNAKLAEVGEKYGLTKTGAAIAWILRHPAKIQPIVGTMNIQRLKEIAQASEVKITREEWYAITGLPATASRKSRGPSMRFEKTAGRQSIRQMGRLSVRDRTVPETFTNHPDRWAEVSFIEK